MDEAWIIVEKDAQGAEKSLCVPQAQGMAVNWLKEFAKLRGEQLGVEPVITNTGCETRAVVKDIEFYLKAAY